MLQSKHVEVRKIEFPNLRNTNAYQETRFRREPPFNIPDDDVYYITSGPDLRYYRPDKQTHRSLFQMASELTVQNIFDR